MSLEINLNINNGKAQRVISVVCTALAAGMILLGSLMYFLLDQRTVSASGSQELTLLPKLTLNGYLDTTFQRDLEQGLKDQFFLHDDAIAMTYGAKGALRALYNTVQNAARATGAGLEPMGDVYRMYGTDWLTKRPYAYSAEDDANYRRKAAEINAFAARYPDAHVYVYYCTRSEDLNWFDAIEGTRTFDYAAHLKSLLDPKIGFSKAKFHDFNDYCRRMYRTDHHWTNVGALQGYTDILLMMSGDLKLGRACSVSHTEDFDGLRWKGSRAREAALTIDESKLDIFAVDQFILDDYRMWFGDREQRIGLIEDYAQGYVNRELGFDQYLNYYGFESEVIRLQFPKGDKNLLIIGDSFARAIREPIASHFLNTVYVNFRILKEADIDALMRASRFDAVLFMGQQDAWSGYFMYEGEGAAQ